MFVALRVLSWLALLCGLSSCVAPVNVRYEDAVRKTEAYLDAQPRAELFELRKLRKEDSMVFQFIEGPFSKSRVVFPLRVTAEVSSAQNGQKSRLNVQAYQQGLLLTSKQRAVAAKWRQSLLHSLSSF